jgi:hypothetical protein
MKLYRVFVGVCMSAVTSATLAGNEKTPPPVTPETISAILSQTSNAIATANTTLWLSAIAVAVLAALMGLGGIVLQVIMTRQRRKFLEEISENIASDEEIQSEIVTKLLAHKNAQKHFSSAFDGRMTEIIERLVAAAVKKEISQQNWNKEKNVAAGDIRNNFGVKNENT